MTIEDLAARVFATRNGAHAAHWKTKSFAQHVALGEFYEAVTGIIDEIVEVAIGQTNEIGSIKSLPMPSPDMITEYLAAESEWIRKNRGKLADNETLGALIDDLGACYDRAVYKLKRLS